MSLKGVALSLNHDLNSVIPAWRAGIQVDMDVYWSVLASLDAGYPCRHDERWFFIFCG
jgi:hypothetical protein